MSFSQNVENQSASVIFVVFTGMCSSAGMMKTKPSYGRSEEVDINSILTICGMSSSHIQKKPKIFISQLYDGKFFTLKCVYFIYE